MTWGVQESVRHDWEAWEGLEPVKLVHTRRAGARVECAVQGKRRALTYKEKQASKGVYQEASTIWMIPDELIQQRPLRQGAVVEQGNGDAWTCLQSDLVVLGSVWKLTTVNLAIAHDLADRVAIERASLPLDAAGAVGKVFPPAGGVTLYANLFVALQPEETDVAEERGIIGQRIKFSVILSRPCSDITTQDRIRVISSAYGIPPGTYLEIRGVKNANRIDELPELEAELVP